MTLNMQSKFSFTQSWHSNWHQADSCFTLYSNLEKKFIPNLFISCIIFFHFPNSAWNTTVSQMRPVRRFKTIWEVNWAFWTNGISADRTLKASRLYLHWNKSLTCRRMTRSPQAVCFVTCHLYHWQETLFHCHVLFEKRILVSWR